MRHIFRTLITIVAALAVVFSGVAFAQEGDPVAECEATGGLWMEDFEGVEGLDICHKYGNEIVECEAQGGEWNINFSGRFCSIDGVSQTLFCGYPDPGGCDSPAVPTEPVTEPTHVESATAETVPSAEPAPSAPLPATETAPASQRAPQYTG